MSMTPMTTTTMMMMTAKTIATSIKAFAVNHDASPRGWSQNWSHLLATAANHSGISTSKALRGLPWAQGVAPEARRNRGAAERDATAQR